MSYYLHIRWPPNGGEAERSAWLKKYNIKGLHASQFPHSSTLLSWQNSLLLFCTIPGVTELPMKGIFITSFLWWELMVTGSLVEPHWTLWSCNMIIGLLSVGGHSLATTLSFSFNFMRLDMKAMIGYLNINRMYWCGGFC